MPTTINNQKNHFLLISSGTTTTYSPSNTKKVFQYILKLLETFKFKTIFIVMPKKDKKKNKQDEY